MESEVDRDEDTMQVDEDVEDTCECGRESIDFLFDLLMLEIWLD